MIHNMVELYRQKEADRFKVIFKMEMKLVDNIIEDIPCFMTANSDMTLYRSNFSIIIMFNIGNENVRCAS